MDATETAQEERALTSWEAERRECVWCKGTGYSMHGKTETAHHNEVRARIQRNRQHTSLFTHQSGRPSMGCWPRFGLRIGLRKRPLGLCAHHFTKPESPASCANVRAARWHVRSRGKLHKPRAQRNMAQ